MPPFPLASEFIVPLVEAIGKSRAEGPQSAIPDRLFEMGRYGQKTGAGWYKYDAPGSRNRTTAPATGRPRTVSIPAFA